MAEEKYAIPDNPRYSEDIRKIQDTDPVSASGVINPLVQRLVENAAALQRMLENQGGSLEETRELIRAVRQELLQAVQEAAEAVRQAAETAQKTGETAQQAAESARKAGETAQQAAGAAQQAANTAQQTATAALTRAIFAAQSSAPSDKGLLWIDTSSTTGGLKYYNGSAWVYVPAAYAT